MPPAVSSRAASVSARSSSRRSPRRSATTSNAAKHAAGGGGGQDPGLVGPVQRHRREPRGRAAERVQQLRAVALQGGIRAVGAGTGRPRVGGAGSDPSSRPAETDAAPSPERRRNWRRSMLMWSRSGAGRGPGTASRARRRWPRRRARAAGAAALRSRRHRRAADGDQLIQIRQLASRGPDQLRCARLQQRRQQPQQIPGHRHVGGDRVEVGVAAVVVIAGQRVAQCVLEHLVGTQRPVGQPELGRGQRRAQPQPREGRHERRQLGRVGPGAPTGRAASRGRARACESR